MPAIMEKFQEVFDSILKESNIQLLNEEIKEYEIILNRVTETDNMLAKEILKTIRERCKEMKLKFRKEFREEWRKFRELDYEEEKMIGVNRPIEKFLELEVEQEPDTYSISLRIEDPESANEIIDDKLKEQIKSIGTLDGFDEKTNTLDINA